MLRKGKWMNKIGGKNKMNIGTKIKKMAVE